MKSEAAATPQVGKHRPFAPVALIRTEANRSKVYEAVFAAMEAADWKRFVSAGADVALKPNLGWDKLVPGAISAPWVVEAVICAIRDHVGHIYLVESDQVVVDVEDALRISGLEDVCRRHKVTWHNLSNGQFVRVKNPDNLVLRDIRLPEILTRTELITLPLLKTHNKTTMTGAIKNQWGCLETLRHNYHLVLAEALVDINRIVQPRFGVMDGTIGLEGNGPKSGKPKVMNLVLASGDPVGLDAVAASIMGFDPREIEHLRLCAEYGLGCVDGEFDIRGCRIEDVAQSFKPAKHNAVSWLELILRKSTLEQLVFHTPLLEVMTWGTRRYYDIWDMFVGRNLRDGVLSTSGYARQWLGGNDTL